MDSVPNLRFALLVEAAAQREHPAPDDVLGTVYRFFLRAAADSECAKRDMIAFLQSGNLPAPILSFARECVVADGQGAARHTTDEVSPTASKSISRPTGQIRQGCQLADSP